MSRQAQYSCDTPELSRGDATVLQIDRCQYSPTIRGGGGRGDPLRILFDGFWWRDGPPSGRNVLTSIVREWQSVFSEDEIALAVPAAVAGPAAAEFPDRVEVLASHLPQHGLSTVCELGRYRPFDVVFSHNFTPLFTRALRATFVHDVMFQDRPEWFTRSELLYLAAVPVLARKADLIFTSSRAEAQRIGQLNPGLRARTRDVGLGLSHTFSNAELRRPQLSVQPKRFILAVGRVNIRKNLNKLVDSLVGARLIGPEFPLVVVGAKDGLTVAMPSLASASRTGTVLQTGYISDGELRWLYANCATFVFPSLDEGFGLPVLEAADNRAPIALSRIPAFQEFGDVGSFFDPTDAKSIADAVTESILNGPSAGAGGLTMRFSWAATVARIRESLLERV